MAHTALLEVHIECIVGRPFPCYGIAPPNEVPCRCVVDPVKPDTQFKVRRHAGLARACGYAEHLYPLTLYAWPFRNGRMRLAISDAWRSLEKHSRHIRRPVSPCMILNSGLSTIG